MRELSVRNMMSENERNVRRKYENNRDSCIILFRAIRLWGDGNVQVARCFFLLIRAFFLKRLNNVNLFLQMLDI